MTARTSSERKLGSRLGTLAVVPQVDRLMIVLWGTTFGNRQLELGACFKHTLLPAALSILTLIPHSKSKLCTST